MNVVALPDCDKKENKWKEWKNLEILGEVQKVIVTQWVAGIKLFDLQSAPHAPLGIWRPRVADLPATHK